MKRPDKSIAATKRLEKSLGVDLTPPQALLDFKDQQIKSQLEQIRLLSAVVSATPYTKRYRLAMAVVDALRPWMEDGEPAQRSYDLEDCADDAAEAMKDFLDYEENCK